MPHWLLKAGVQGLLSILPGSHSLNYLFQKHVSRSLDLTPARFETKLREAARHYAYYREAAPTPHHPFRVLELGTGWYPILPIALYLCGASSIRTLDRTALLNARRVRMVLERCAQYAEGGRLGEFLPAIQEQRIHGIRAALRTDNAAPIAELLRPLNMEYITCDARSVPLENACADFIFSNVTLGWIPQDVLRSILIEFRRLIASDGVMCHSIDLTDLYAAFDRRLSPYHFLRFSPRVWRLFNNSIQYQNRLRISDYRRLHVDAGFRIVREDVNPGSIDALRQVPLAEVFRGYALEDLAVTSAWIVSRPRDA